MKSSRIFAGAVVVLLSAGFSAVALGQTDATPQEVVAKVKEAAAALSKSGDLSQFDQKQGPWVWKNTYIFIQDCNKKVMAAHPIKPEMIGKGLDTVMDAKSGKAIYADPAAWCKKVEAAPTGLWNEYYWPKPGEKEPSRKVAYHLTAKGTSYIVSSGIYDEKTSLAEVSKVSSMK